MHDYAYRLHEAVPCGLWIRCAMCAVIGAPCVRGVACAVSGAWLCVVVLRRSKRVGACRWLCVSVCGVARSVRGSVRVWQCLAVIGRECAPCVRRVGRVRPCVALCASVWACGSVCGVSVRRDIQQRTRRVCAVCVACVFRVVLCACVWVRVGACACALLSGERVRQPYGEHD